MPVSILFVATHSYHAGLVSFCHVGSTCRCVESRLFGTPHTPGGQAQYVRVPKAGGTVYNLQEVSATREIQKLDMKETIPNLADSSLLLLCDILPTGVFAAFQALNHPKILPMVTSLPFPHSSIRTFGDNAHSTIPSLRPEATDLTIAILGLGPVGVVGSFRINQHRRNLEACHSARVLLFLIFCTHVALTSK